MIETSTSEKPAVPPKRMLVVRASRDVAQCEIDFLDPLSQILSFRLGEADIIELYRGKVGQSLQDLPSDTYDLVYLCGHGDQWGLGGHNDLTDPYASWIHLSDSMCDSLRADATLVLGCCDGGLTTVAYDFLEACPRLRHIFGLAGSVLPEELVLAMHVILSGVTADLVDGQTAAERAASAIGRRVTYRDGNEVRYSDAFFRYAYEGLQMYKYNGYIEASGLELAPSTLDPDQIGSATRWDLDDLAVQRVIEGVGAQLEPASDSDF